MPIIRSAKKALRQNIKRRRRNEKRKKLLRQIIKDYKKSALAKKSEEAQSALSLVYQALDKAAKTHLLKKNKASRLKSRLSKLLIKK